MITYEYYPAVKPDGSPKPGINRITYENNVEVTREYLPEDPRTQPATALQAVMSAKPEEIEQIKKILGIS